MVYIEIIVLLVKFIDKFHAVLYVQNFKNIDVVYICFVIDFF